VAIRKDVLEQVGGFRELRGVEDFDLWWRLIAVGHVPKKMRGPPLAVYRSRGLDSSRFEYRGYYESFTRSINDFLERNRQKADPEVLGLAREFRIGVYIAYFIRCVKKRNLALACRALGEMTQRDFSLPQFLKMATKKLARAFGR